MFDICQEEYERFLSDMECNTFRNVQYVDSWDYECEYSHNCIDKNRDIFIEMTNRYFTENNLPYVMQEICDNAMICDINGHILR